MGNIFLSGNVGALTYSSDTNIEFTFNPTIGVSLSSDLHIDDLAPGDTSDSNIITVSVVTNTAYGYTLNATVGQATNYETRNLVLDGNNSYNFASINYGASLASLTTDNTWGYAYLPSTSGASWTTYSGLPLYSDTTNVATLISTDEAADNDSVQFKIAAKASNAQASGEYKNVINFIAVANPEPQLEPVACEAGKICYNVNSLDPTEGTMAKQSAGDNVSVMLYPSNFSRDGYGFAGWNTSYDYTGTNYGPMETITTPADTSTNGLSLYAIWVPSAGSIQNWTCPSNAYMHIGEVTALTDQRDGDTYAVAKLVDGKCWMIENLRLDNTNSDNATGALAQGYGTSATYGNFSGLATPELPWASQSTTANSLYSADGANNTISIDASNAAYRFPRYNNQNTSSRASTTTTSGNIYSYGNYYTWASAIADTSNYANVNGQSIENTSICPSGWHLPTGGGAYPSDGTTGVNITGSPSTYREFYKLGYEVMNEVKTAYEDTPNDYYSYYSNNTTNSAGDTATKALRKYPNNFVYSGYIHNGSINARGSYGGYWASTTATSYNNAYNLGLNNSLIYPGTYGTYKYEGVSIRCIASGT